jgi:hypothetical protein
VTDKEDEDGEVEKEGEMGRGKAIVLGREIEGKFIGEGEGERGLNKMGKEVGR